ncbi:MAG: succinate:quinone oxidoreductase, partial [Thermodesulfobacteriota bacterium]
MTGAAMFGFVAGHLVGNLQVFLGPEPLNRYGAFLKSNKELLW